MLVKNICHFYMISHYYTHPHVPAKLDEASPLHSRGMSYLCEDDKYTQLLKRQFLCLAEFFPIPSIHYTRSKTRVNGCFSWFQLLKSVLIARY